MEMAMESWKRARSVACFLAILVLWFLLPGIPAGRPVQRTEDESHAAMVAAPSWMENVLTLLRTLVGADEGGGALEPNGETSDPGAGTSDDSGTGSSGGGGEPTPVGSSGSGASTVGDSGT